MRKFIDIITNKIHSDSNYESGWSFLTELSEQIMSETAPPGKKPERFIKKSKKDFKKRYGKNWEKVLYATAWKNFGK